MSAVAKRAYYDDRGLRRGLAFRYYRQLGDSRRVLDLGCGLGDFGRLWPVADTEVYGLDVDSGAVERASRWEIARHWDLEDAMPLPFEDAFFDAVVARDVLEHLLDPGRVVRELYRLLRPGGNVIASVIMAKPRLVWSDYTHVRGFTEKTARLLFEDAGFAVEAVWRMGGVPFSDRLGFIDAVPHLLRLPIFAQLWASSWELRAQKPWHTTRSEEMNGK
jgi:SAM-dependent methyltransferase